jgi:hypothetical protein
MVAYHGFAALLAGSLWPLYGGLLVIVDLHASYRYAIYCGMRRKVGKKLGGRSAGAGAPAPPPGDTDSLLSPDFVTDRYSGGVVRAR